uniref:Profilin n=1 Tax=Pyxicephalus adspersus TaxID=30357 RepID=A0AAV2ZVZ5_PYXAD|nr:TPA: hypothetical protein GDO54_015433 [Pyxicephalus adspersus]
MQKDDGQFMDLNKKCSASNSIFGAKENASIQINITEAKKTGTITGQYKTYPGSGSIPQMGESNDAILRLAKSNGIVSKNF